MRPILSDDMSVEFLSIEAILVPAYLIKSQTYALGLFIKQRVHLSSHISIQFFGFILIKFRK